MVRTFLGLTKSETQGARFDVKQLYHEAKTVWNSFELLLLLFLIGLFLGYVLGRWTFFGSGYRLFLGLTISPHSHIPVTNIPEYPPWETSSMQLKRHDLHPN